MKMTVKALLKLMECGSLISIWDRTNDMQVVPPTYWDSDSWRIFEPYFDQEILVINTSDDDCDIEIII